MFKWLALTAGVLTAVIVCFNLYWIADELEERNCIELTLGGTDLRFEARGGGSGESIEQLEGARRISGVITRFVDDSACIA